MWDDFENDSWVKRIDQSVRTAYWCESYIPMKDWCWLTSSKASLTYPWSQSRFCKSCSWCALIGTTKMGKISCDSQKEMVTSVFLHHTAVSYLTTRPKLIPYSTRVDHQLHLNRFCVIDILIIALKSKCAYFMSACCYMLLEYDPPTSMRAVTSCRIEKLGDSNRFKVQSGVSTFWPAAHLPHALFSVFEGNFGHTGYQLLSCHWV